MVETSTEQLMALGALRNPDARRHAKRKTARKYRIADIKARNAEAGQFFFRRDTLRFHKDRVSNWGVWHVFGRVFIHHKATGEVREFSPVTGHIGTPIAASDWEKIANKDHSAHDPKWKSMD